MGFLKTVGGAALGGVAGGIAASGIGKKSPLPTTPAVPQPTMINANTQQAVPSLLNTPKPSLY